MKLAGVLILTCGLAAGQKAKPCTDGINVCTDHSMTLAAPIEGAVPSLSGGEKVIWASQDHVLHLEGSWCENSIRVGSTTKSVKELFPAECGVIAIHRPTSEQSECVEKATAEYNRECPYDDSTATKHCQREYIQAYMAASACYKKTAK